MEHRFAVLPVFASLFLFSFPRALRGDTVVVTPNADASVSGPVIQYALFGEGTNPTTFQFDVAASQLTAVVGDTIDAIGFRLPAGAAGTTGPTTIGMFNLELSSSLNPIGALSPTFAANIGANGETVRSGSLTLGPLTGGAGPNPFFFLNFSSPYLYTGGDLLSTVMVNNATNLTLAVDANTLGPLADTVGLVGSGTSGTPEFFNSPVAAFSFSTPSTTAVTPEPSSVALLLTGMGALGGQLRRRLQRSAAKR